MFNRNRQRLFDVIGGGLVVLTAYDAMQWSGDMETAFLQESTFWWLTGVEEAGWKVIIDGSRRRTTLVRPNQSDIEVFFGGSRSDEELKAHAQADEVINMNDFEPRLRQLHRHHSVVQTISEPRSYGFVANPASKQLHTILTRIFDGVQDCTQQVNKLRAIKQPDELAAMQRAIDLTTNAFEYIHEHLPEYKNECEIDAEFTYRFRRAAATHAFQPVVAAGSRTCTIHYFANNQKINARDVIVMDIGARVDGYSADVARTYCRNPTKRQRAVHAALEKAHFSIIDLIKPGVSVAQYLATSDTIMKEALMSLGLLDNMSDNELYRHYFPHAIGHGLGIDPHDSLGAPRMFEPGMVVTVEPGIYIVEEGIGMRIEDDILVTPTGHKNLSGKLSTALN